MSRHWKTTCDVCAATVDGDSPDGWYKMSLDAGSTYDDVCSLACVKQVAQQRLDAFQGGLNQLRITIFMPAARADKS